MHAIVLAAGFGRRLRPYTEEKPKALLEIGGKPVIDYLIELLVECPDIGTIHIRTNALYYPLFKEWLRSCYHMGRVELSSNGLKRPEERLGAVRELEDVFARNRFNGCTLVAAADNIFDFPIAPFLDFCSNREGDAVVVIKCRDKKALRAGGVVVVTSDDRIIDFEEKPKICKSSLLAIPLYRLSEETAPFLKKYLVEKNDPDSLGSFFAWSYRRRPLFAFRTDGGRYHLTDAASYRRIRSAFAKRPRA
jgi:glucose-1-phosphate thymidylyltransferase